MSNKKVKTLWTLLVCALVLVAVRWGVSYYDGARTTGWHAATQQERREIRSALYPVLFEYGIRVDWVRGDSLHKRVRVPADLSLDPLYAALAARFVALGGELLQAQSNPDGDRKRIEVGLDGRPVLEVTLRRDKDISRPGGKIALVIDVAGRTPVKSLEDFLEGGKPVTLSIAPGRKYSAEAHAAAVSRKTPFLLDLSLDAADGQSDDGAFRLEPGMGEKQIRKQIRAAMSALPHAVGVNSGSKSNGRVKGVLLPPLMRQLKRGGLLFFDGMGDPESPALAVAHSYDVAAVRCNLTLDEAREASSIRRQLHRLGEIAVRNGSAVGIGSAGAVTLQTLGEEMPKMERLGFRFVLLSELAQ